MNTSVTSNIKSLLLITVGIILTGCGIPSIHPLYEPADLKTDNTLQGVWQKAGSDVRYHVIKLADLEEFMIASGDTSMSIKSTRSDDFFTGEVEVEQGMLSLTKDFEDRGLGNLYLVQNELTRTELFLVGVVELGGNRYLDFKQLNFNMDAFSYPVHLFMKASICEDTLKVNMFSENWLKEQIRNRQVRIKYEVNLDENYILTAPTTDLKKFVEKYGGIEEAYRSTNSYIKTSGQPVFKFEELEDSVEQE